MKLAHLDAGDSLRLGRNGIYERQETDFVRHTLKSGQVFVDVGAHIGYYTALAAEIVGPTGEVFAFEPASANLEILRKNVSGFNGVVHIYPRAVSDGTGMTELYLSPRNSGDHHLYRTATFTREVVWAERLDDIPALKGRAIDFIKVDVQGFETRVLRGAQNLIEISPNLIGIIEFAPIYLKLAGSGAHEFLEMVDSLSFYTYWFQGGRLVPAPFTELLRRRRHLNLIVSRKELE